MVSRYRQKRDPSRTTEPFSAEQAARPEETRAGRFVVHQHAARRMHWDLRLPGRGGLLSFAIPRGPSLDPSQKRLAVHTEDHPLQYLEFEDVIPAGNYGAGAMIVWDTGGVTYLGGSAEDGIRVGKIDFVLNGFKLKGRFALIATGRRKSKSTAETDTTGVNEWLLVKKPDEAAAAEADVSLELDSSAPHRSVFSGLTCDELARKSELAEELAERAAKLGAAPIGQRQRAAGPPMVCATQGAPVASPGWCYELKLDGVRIVASKSGERVSLTYRSGRDATPSYPEIQRAVRALAPGHVVLDGEIVTFDERGQPNFQRLAPRIHARRVRDVDRVRLELPVAYLVFDLLELGPWDLTKLPLSSRKELLAELVRGKGYLRRLDHISGRGDALWQLVETEELEGMIAKRTDSAYCHGPRVTGDWVKIKREIEDEFVVHGYTPGKGTRGPLGALCIGSYRQGVVVARGRVGSGMDQSTLQQLHDQLRDLHEHWKAAGRPPVVQASDEELGDCALVTPELVVRVRFQGFTETGHLRAPVFLGLRHDVDPRTCTAAPKEDIEEEAEQSIPAGAKPSVDSQSSGVGTPVGSSSPSVRKFHGSNLDKVFWPDEGYTKGDLIRYYNEVAHVMLPFLRERPVVLVRYPDGIDGKSFYQWRVPPRTPEWIATVELYDEEKQKQRGAQKTAFLVHDRETLSYIANLGCIPLHVLASRRETPELCDFLTIDFDLGERAFRDAVVLALSLNELLSELSLTGFPKTSGQSGLHVVVPLGAGVRFESAKLLCELLGRVLVARHPDLATMERRIEKRGAKVYVDTGQTGRSRTIVAPYSVRAVPGATVSTPLQWSEVHLALDPRTFTLETVPQRVQAMGDPWDNLSRGAPDLETTLGRLARWTGAGQG